MSENWTSRVFTREQLRKELGLPGGRNKGACVVVSDEIDDTTRWSVLHTLIFRLPDQPENEAWEVSYSVGATEQQDESPWEYEEQVTATLVRQVEKVVKVWEAVRS